MGCIRRSKKVMFVVVVVAVNIQFPTSYPNLITTPPPHLTQKCNEHPTASMLITYTYIVPLCPPAHAITTAYKSAKTKPQARYGGTRKDAHGEWWVLVLADGKWHRSRDLGIKPPRFWERVGREKGKRKGRRGKGKGKVGKVGKEGGM